MSAEDPLLNEAEAGEKSEKTNNEWKSSAKLAILAPLTYVCTYWWRTPLFCLPDSYTNVTILTLGSGVNISYATGSALAFAMGNIVGKTTAVFLFTSNFYYKHRFLVLSFMFCLTAFLNGFGIAAFDSENGFVAHSPLAQVIVAAGLGSIPVSTLFGGIFSYLEGRKSTDLLIAALNFGLIVAGGAARSSAVALIEAGVEPYLMPAVTAAAALVVALPLLFVVDRLPRPSVSDKHERSERGSMSCAQKLALFRRYKHVIGNILFAYMIVMGLRQYRDFFAVELYSNALGFTPTSWTYLLCDLPGALLSCTIIALMSRIKDHVVALRVMFGIMSIGGALLALSALLFSLKAVSGTFFMVLTGIAIYCTYGCMGSPTYDRFMALSRLEGTATLLIFLSDMSGYIGSSSITLYNLFAQGDVSYMSTFLIALVACGCCCFALLFAVLIYFMWCSKNLTAADDFDQPSIVATDDDHTKTLRDYVRGDDS